MFVPVPWCGQSIPFGRAAENDAALNQITQDIEQMAMHEVFVRYLLPRVWLPS
jgi:hypothetical protein